MIVITADRLNPENASTGVSTPVTPNATTTSSATRSDGSRSVKNRTSDAINMTKVIRRLVSIRQF
jgi:hypothetical protein